MHKHRICKIKNKHRNCSDEVCMHETQIYLMLKKIRLKSNQDFRREQHQNIMRLAVGVRVDE